MKRPRRFTGMIAEPLHRTGEPWAQLPGDMGGAVVGAGEEVSAAVDGGIERSSSFVSFWLGLAVV